MCHFLSKFLKKFRGQFQNPQNLTSIVSILMVFTLSIQINMIIKGLLFTNFSNPKAYREFWSSVLSQISTLMSSLIVWITLGINIRNSTESNYRAGVSYIKDLVTKIEDLSKSIFSGTSKPFLDFMAMFYYLLGDADKFVKQRNIDPKLFESFVDARFHNIHLFENLMSQIESILTCDIEKHHKTTNFEEGKMSGGIYLSNYSSSIEASMPKEFIFSILTLSLLNRYDLHTYATKKETSSWKEVMLQLIYEKRDSWRQTQWSNISRVQKNFIDLVCPFFFIESILNKPSFVIKNPLDILEHIEKVLYEDRDLQSLQTLSFYEIPMNMVYNVASKVSILKKLHFEEAFLSSYSDFLLRLTHSCLLRYIEVISPEVIKNSFSLGFDDSFHAVVFFILKDLASVDTHTDFDKKQIQIPWEEFMFLKDIDILPEDKISITAYTNSYKQYVWNATSSKILSKFPTLKSILLEKHRLLKKKNLFPYTKRTSSSNK